MFGNGSSVENLSLLAARIRDDKTLINTELANDGRQAAAEFDLDNLINNLDKNRPLRLSLAGVFSELPVPPFVVKEWRSIN